MQPIINLRYLMLLFFAVCSFGLMPAQTVKELELQRKKTLKTLETTNKLLTETKKSQRSTLNKLTIINRNINERKSLIKNINTEIGQLDVEMLKLETERKKLEVQLRLLRDDYAKLVQEAHINRSMYAKIMFVLSSNSFDQSLRRLRYLQEYTDYRKQQVRQIEAVKQLIQVKNDSLQGHKQTKVEVVKQKEVETKKLSQDEKQEKVLLGDLQKKEKKLRADLKVQQKKANDLNNKIAAMIAAEIRKAEAKRTAERKKAQAAEESKRLAEAKRQAELKKAEEQRKRDAADDAARKLRDAEKRAAKAKSQAAEEELRAAKKAEADARAAAKQAASETKRAEQEAKATTGNSAMSLTKEESLLNGSFAANQGRLPWPTASGYISGRYGVQPHPVLKHVTVNSKGIYIQTPAGSSARAVFDGVVTTCFSFPGCNNAVIIQHGNYRTVYSNLTQIYVQKGQRVSAKQSIGRIFTDAESDNKTELYFQIYNGMSLVNPESWISR